MEMEYKIKCLKMFFFRLPTKGLKHDTIENLLSLEQILPALISSTSGEDSLGESSLLGIPTCSQRGQDKNS